MELLNSLFSGIIQGLTEFLPVSSSGHLVIFNRLFGEGESNLSLTVFLHFATLLSVVIVYYKDIWLLIREFFLSLWDLLRGKPDFKTPERRFLLMVIIGTLPAVAVGLGVKLLNLEAVLENIFTVAVMLLVTAAFMFLVDKLSRKGKLDEANAPLPTALLVGCLQAVAVLPGLSRSGSTIFGGVLGGLKKEFAIKFAFILSIPAILGAGVLELFDAAQSGGLGIAPLNLLVGFVSAAVFGVLSIKFINLLIKNNKFWVFGVYCLLASALAFYVGCR
jgi:undecaprenyl-diphosphatase